MTREKIISRVLEIREYTTEQLEAEVKKARDRLFTEQEMLESFERVHQSTCSEFTERQTKGELPLRELELYYAYLKHLGRQIDQQKRIVAIRSDEVDACQRALMEAYREQRLVGKLHEKLVDRELRTADKVEQKEMDYSFLMRRADR